MQLAAVPMVTKSRYQPYRAAGDAASLTVGYANEHLNARYGHPRPWQVNQGLDTITNSFTMRTGSVWGDTVLDSPETQVLLG